MSVLLAHEKKGGTNSMTSIKAALPQESSDSSDNEENVEMQTVDTGMNNILNNRNFNIRKISNRGAKNYRRLI